MVNGDLETQLALYRLYLDTAEKASDRRLQANTWMLSVNSAVVALYGYLGAGSGPSAGNDRGVWLWAIPATGIIVCVAWAALLESYRKVNAAKYRVLQDMERGFSPRLFTDEWTYYSKEKRTSLSHIEMWIPVAFALLYFLILGARLVQTLAST
jgi:hypothetical protein